MGCTERQDAGLSMYGVEVVERCNELGIIIDTSHCSRQTTLDAIELSETPVFANHSCAQGVFEHARGKSDKELRAIADSGGVLGVVTVPFFLSPDADSTIEVMLDHIDYISNLVGWQHVGIGTDWPMQAPEDVLQATLGAMVGDIGFRSQDKISVTQTLRGFDDYRDMPNITRGLVARGYTDEQIAGILGGNFLRVFEEVCG
jgi:membrane dipeptidase